MRKYLLVLLSLVIPAALWAQPSVEQLFQQLKSNPQALRIFLHKMPKGGELHYHWDGSDYPENIAYMINHDHYCYDASILGASTNITHCTPTEQLNNLGSKPSLYRTLIESWSLTGKAKNFLEANRHFFQVFLGLEAVTAKYSGAQLVEDLNRAAEEDEDYMEMAYILDLPKMISLGNTIHYQGDFSELLKQLNASPKTGQIIHNIVDATSRYYHQAQQQMQCGTPSAQPGCRVKTRFIFAAMRNMPAATIFTQLYIGFKVAQLSPYVVGVDLVGPEADFNDIHTYTLQMKMVQFLHQKFPNTHIRLHAGELSLNDSSPDYMRSHIDQAINIAGVQRIGHGTDIAYETNALQVLHEMAKRHIAVEQLLTSNEKLLGIKGKEHPLPLYLRFHVPVVLSTDDEGILRTTLTNEFYKAVTRYNLSYSQIKAMVRNVPTYSFLPGKNLWVDLSSYKVVKACANQPLGNKHPSIACRKFLSKSEKAQMQWRLEQELRQFEKTIVKEFATN